MAFLAPIGFALGVGSAATATTAATGVLAASLVGGAVVGGTAAGIAGMVKSASQKMPEVKSAAPPQVTATVPTTAEEKATVVEAEKRKLQQGRTGRSTILTSPQGILTPANVGIKTLLGQ
jgi:hypothetical protein